MKTRDEIHRRIETLFFATKNEIRTTLEFYKSAPDQRNEMKIHYLDGRLDVLENLLLDLDEAERKE